MKRWAVLAAVAAIGLCGASQPPPSGPAQEGRPEAKSNQRGTYAAPVFVEVVPAPETKAEAAENKRDRERQARNEGWMVFLTAVLAALGVVQVVVTGITLRGLKHAEVAAKAADAAADAAKHSVEIASDTARKQLRAYVMVTLMGAAMPKGKNGGAAIEIFNRGQTPADKVIVLWGLFVADANTTPEDIDRADVAAGNPGESEMLLGPGEHRGANVEVDPFELDEIAEVRASDAYLWVVGRVEYVDAFGHRRRTRFCHRYQGPKIGPDEGTYGHYGNSYT